MSEVDIRTSLGKDTNLSRLNSYSCGRTDGGYREHVEKPCHKNRMLGITFNRDDENLTSNFCWTGNPQAPRGKCRIRNPSTLNCLRLNGHLYGVCNHINTGNDSMTRLPKRTGLRSRMQLDCFEPISHRLLLLPGRSGL